MSFLSKLIQKHRHKKESFQARLQMETDAQKSVAARLNKLDIRLRNEGRLK